jgi:hypothetical protein
MKREGDRRERRLRRRGKGEKNRRPRLMIDERMFAHHTMEYVYVWAYVYITHIHTHIYRYKQHLLSPHLGVFVVML